MAKIIKDHNTLAQKASKLHISAITLAENMKNGNFKSIYKGQGIEFSGVRDYFPGDNVRAIDWNVTARMGRPFIKQYEEDREIQVLFILDRSASMTLGSNGKSKLETASEAAALLVLAAEQNSSALGAVLFDGKIQFSCSPKPGREQAMMILSHLTETTNDVMVGSVLSNALAGAQKLLKKKSLIFVLSDFRTTGWEDSFARLALKNDVIALRITDPIDSELPKIGTVTFVDSESGARKLFPTSSNSFAEKWFEDNRYRLDSWNEFCIRHGAYPLMLSTTEDSALVLSRFFAKRGRK